MSGPAAVATPHAVVTGIGVVAPTGIGVEEHWRSVLAGKSGIGRIRRFDPSSYPTQLAGEVAGFATEQLVPARLAPATDRWTHLAFAAADLALADAAVDPAQFGEYEMSVVTASSSGGTDFGQREMDRLYNNGPDWVSAYQSIAWFYAATTGQLSIRHGMRGPCGVFCSEQAGGLDAIGQARRLLRAESRLVVTGGTDSSLCPYGLTAQLATGKLSSVDDPLRAYLPFDADASGYLPGEGGAILVVEHDGGAGVGSRWGTIDGYAAGFDPRPGSGRPPALQRVIEQALDDAGLSRADIHVVFADAVGFPADDIAEATAITAVFGPNGVPVTAPKTLTGRLYGGAALDVATAFLALRDQVVPHTVGPTGPAPGMEIDLVVDAPRPAALDAALVLARGEGGFTSALVIRRAHPPTSDRPQP